MSLSKESHFDELHPSVLKPHPRNTELFDNITGDKWKQFLESIKEAGVYEPITVARQSSVIISGHQRVRACLELGLPLIKCRLIYFSGNKYIERSDKKYN